VISWFDEDGEVVQTPCPLGFVCNNLDKDEKVGYFAVNGSIYAFTNN
jgi:hypothetical protein